MNYTKKSFSVNAPGTQTYRDNWERTFRGSDRPCPVHPQRTGGEVKCIGLFRRAGETHEDAYARWSQERRGEKCICGGLRHNRSDGSECPYLAERVCNKCGWVKTMPQCDSFFSGMRCRLDEGHADLHVYSHSNPRITSR